MSKRPKRPRGHVRLSHMVEDFPKAVNEARIDKMRGWVGKRVRVKMANGELGDTLYEVSSVKGFRCYIREVGHGRLYAPQLFDTSLLEVVA